MMPLKTDELYSTLQQALQDVAPEVINGVFAEWHDISRSLDEGITEWLQTPHNQAQHKARLMRLLHTLKGSVRTLGLQSTGDMAHNLEQCLEHIELSDAPPSTDFVQKYQALQAHMHAIVQYGQTEHTSIQADNPVTAAAEDIPAHHIPAPVAWVPKAHKSKPEASAYSFSIKVPAVFLEDMLYLTSEVSVLGHQLAKQQQSSQHLLDNIHQKIDLLSDAVQILVLDAHNEKTRDTAVPIDLLAIDRQGDSIPSLAQVQRQLRDLQRQHETLYQQQLKLSHRFHQQTQHHQSMQDKLLQKRMITVRQILVKLQQVVQQTAVELGKLVTFEMPPEDALIDRMVMEQMIAPLEHMLRNAVSHGIETPEQRKAHNKPEQGHVQLSIRRTPAYWIFQVQDDGAGLSQAKLQKHAKEHNISQDTETLSDEQLQALIVTPGLSTADTITSVSGRGIGMDVVNRRVIELGGHMRVQSTPNQGTCFTLYLPLTFALSVIMQLRVGSLQYAFLSSTVDTIISVPIGDLAPNQTEFMYADTKYSLLWIAHLLHMSDRSSKPATLSLILMTQDHHKQAFVVDEVTNRQSVVIKPLGLQLMGKTGIVGGAVLDDGQSTIVLDLMMLAQWQPTAAPIANTDSPPLVMVVDDSRIVRSISRALLEKANYCVIEAENGDTAIELMGQQQPNLLLLDVEMPEKDGFDVLCWMRNQARYQHTPVIMISSRVEAEHQLRAEKMGVQHYMSKPFDSERLLKIMNSILR